MLHERYSIDRSEKNETGVKKHVTQSFVNMSATCEGVGKINGCYITEIMSGDRFMEQHMYHS